MVPREILKLRTSEIARNVYFLFIFASSKFLTRPTKLHGKKDLARDFEKWGACPLYFPNSYVQRRGQS